MVAHRPVAAMAAMAVLAGGCVKGAGGSRRIRRRRRHGMAGMWVSRLLAVPGVRIRCLGTMAGVRVGGAIA